MNKISGYMVLEVINSNPNGDVDAAGRPRELHDGIGVLTGVSVKRKIRDLINMKNGPVWTALFHNLDQSRFQIFEVNEFFNSPNIEGNLDIYWDNRVFGMALKTGPNANRFLASGVVQIGVGMSLAQIDVIELPITRKAARFEGEGEGKNASSSMGRYTVVRHGVYIIPFFINPTNALKSRCTDEDIEVFKKVLPYTYSHTASMVRSQCNLRSIWWVEHKTPLGSCPEHIIQDAITPKVMADPIGWADYQAPSLDSVQTILGNRIQLVEDLII